MVTREEIFTYVKSKYGTTPETTFSKFPKYCILRHKKNEKWYGLVMNVSKDKLNIEEYGETDVIDVKVEPEILGVLIEKEGFYKAYHMNKENWVSIDLNSQVTSKEIEKMIDTSFDLTS